MQRTFVICVGLAALGAPAAAQTPSPTPAISQPPGKTLSDKLNATNGVIQPKEVDPGIEKTTPQTGDPNVIPPGAAPNGPATPK